MITSILLTEKVLEGLETLKELFSLYVTEMHEH